MSVIVNGRAMAQPITGVQRYAIEISQLLDGKVEIIQPSSWTTGVKGHLWEQFKLPLLTADKLLWSPCNTGPLSVKKQVVTIHDLSPIDHPEWMSRKFAAWYGYLLPRLARNVRRVITDSEFTKERIIQVARVPGDKVVVIPLGVNSDFKPVEEAQCLNLKQENIVPSNKYILSLGSLEPRKNLSRLLEAWKGIVESIPDDIYLVLAGAMGKASVFRSIGFEELPPRVHFTGRVPDQTLPHLIGGAMAFVYVSQYEGFGLPPLEAMACGVPVICSNTTSLPEVVGDAAIKVDPYDVAEIADNLLRIINSEQLREDLKDKGLIRSRLFSWDKAAAQTWQVLEEAAMS